MNSPLEGIRVLDLTHVHAGPSCTQLLAWLGAEVIKIEEPGVGDGSRAEMAHRPGVDSVYFLLFNSNKKSLTLNLKSVQGKEIFKRLVRVSDVIVENMGPGTLDRLGLGYEEISEVNPKIVYGSIKGFGSYGPNAGLKSFEHIAQAMGGAISTNGESGRAPFPNSAYIGDTGTGLHLAIGLLAALRQRDDAGIGQHVEVSMQDSVVNLMRFRFVDSLVRGEPVARDGNRTGGRPSMVFPCYPGGQDDYVAIVTGGEAWDSLLAIMERADLIGDERYATAEARAQRPDEVERLISEWTSARTKQEVMATLTEVGIPCGEVLSTIEVIEDAHLRARQMVVEVDDSLRGNYLTIGSPIKLSANETNIASAPTLGEHSDEVLSTLLGLTSEEIASLKNEGVI
ncbi:MAG: formyl-CoA transferase [Chloroflexi bacterium]|nr:formyl-CoA transferase [Chloroflexota bacterium]